ncbi:glycosyltransferase family 4 protein [Paenibacillus sp. FSL W8-0426]|uniref:glycosyltransferase family 4 protein n=1 Tax=Paenibacillus sp. FSL W8-0426 TaxID=2921714 RepID=UPI0030D8B63D
METRPKLMLFSHVCNTRSITGAEKLLLHFMREMGTIFDCVLVVPREGKLAGLAQRSGIRVKVCEFPLLYGVYTPYKGIGDDAEQLRHKPEFQAVVSLIRETGPDLVLTNTCVNVLPAIAAKSLQIPVIWKITEIMQSTDHLQDAIRLIAGYSDWIITISNAAALPFREAGIEDKLTVLPPTWDSSLPAPDRWLYFRERKRKELGFKSSHVCIGYISSFIHDAKGLKPFVDMCLRICETHPRARFWIIGTPADKKYYDACISRVKKSGYQRRFEMTPFVENVSMAYPAMDILVIPSMVKEGFGMTALEGMHFAKPVIAFTQGGLAELMEGVGSGEFLAPPGDSAALAELAARLIDNEELASDTGWRNRAEAERLYGNDAYRTSLHAMVTQWLLRFPGWFPYIQSPTGPVYGWGEGGLRTVLVSERNGVSAKRFPLSVIEALPKSPLPPLAIEGGSGGGDGPLMYPAAVKRGKKRRKRRESGNRLAKRRMLGRKARTGGRKGRASKRKRPSRAVKVKTRKRRLA